MRIAIIINEINNASLLRFTETKLFFDAKNQGTNFVTDCIVVDSYKTAIELSNSLKNTVILKTGDFLTTKFRLKNKDRSGCIIADTEDVIKFDPDTYIGFRKKCHYKQGTKQLYIIENLLKTCLRNKELVYLDNTENFKPVSKKNFFHFYGLASGWKSIQLANDIGLEQLQSITIYDKNKLQLEHAKWIHSNIKSTQIPVYKNSCGIYNPDAISEKLWTNWKNFPVKFQQLDLFETPIFKEHSLVWISNIFCYEPNLFNLGWQACKTKKQKLIDMNPTCTFI